MADRDFCPMREKGGASNSHCFRSNRSPIAHTSLPCRVTFLHEGAGSATRPESRCSEPLLRAVAQRWEQWREQPDDDCYCTLPSEHAPLRAVSCYCTLPLELSLATARSP